MAPVKIAGQSPHHHHQPERPQLNITPLSAKPLPKFESLYYTHDFCCFVNFNIWLIFSHHVLSCCFIIYMMYGSQPIDCFTFFAITY